MNLKNYTSEVPASTSMSKIEKSLVEAGATDISKKYSERICTAVRFRLEVNSIPMFFELPARVDACFKVMWKAIAKPQKGTEKRVLEQAERTAWKIISDWVAIQISMIQLEQAELLQVFLPYVFDPSTEKTYYSQLKDAGFKQLTNG